MCITDVDRSVNCVAEPEETGDMSFELMFDHQHATGAAAAKLTAAAHQRLQDSSPNVNMKESHAEILDRFHRSPLHSENERPPTTPTTGTQSPRCEGDDDAALSETPNTLEGELVMALRQSSRMGSRSDSIDRRLNEAAQFYEAVGEIPPRSIQSIIEDDQSLSDDEHQATEIRVTSEATPPPIPAIVSRRLPRTAALRPKWPFQSSDKHPRISLFHSLPEGVRPQDFVYKGIRSNPPEITHRGISRGNYSQLHRKAWLEVADKKHRYGKNLRLYYRHWESLGFPTNDFFDWLDSTGDASGLEKPELPDCPRSELDSDTVLYIHDIDITKRYALSVACESSGRARILDIDGETVATGSDGWIFVMRDDALYGAQKILSVSDDSKQRFHHSSFFGGKAVSAAGIIVTDDEGYLLQLFPHSGHYRPGEADLQRMLFYLHNRGVDLRTFEVDTQQLIHISREDRDAKKKKKIQSLHLKPADAVAHYLSHKARCIDSGIFEEIHRGRTQIDSEQKWSE